MSLCIFRRFKSPKIGYTLFEEIGAFLSPVFEGLNGGDVSEC